MFKVTLMLADAVQAVGGKLYILGGGWTRLYADVPFAIAVKIEVPWDEADAEHHWRLELVDQDGQPVEVPTGPGQVEPLVLEDPFLTGRPDGVKPGTPIDWVGAMTFAGLALKVGRYEWRFSVDSFSDEDWRLTFDRADRPEPPESREEEAA